MSGASIRVIATTAAKGSGPAVRHVTLALVIAATLPLGWGPWGEAHPASAAPPPAGESTLLPPSDVRALEARGWLERDDARALRILGSYGARAVGVEAVRLADVRIAHLEALECALGRVAARQLGVAQFFADGVFRGAAPAPIVLVDGPTSVALDRIFDLHTIFPAEARDGGGRQVHMLFLLAGQGKLMMAYDGALTYSHPDGAYSIFGNRDYHLYPFVRMTIGLHRGSPALLDLATAEGPAASLGPFKKRVLFLNPAIRDLYIHDRDVTADTSVIDRKIRPPPVEWRQGPGAGAARLQALGCPPGQPWQVPSPGSQR